MAKNKKRLDFYGGGQANSLYGEAKEKYRKARKSKAYKYGKTMRNRIKKVI